MTTHNGHSSGAMFRRAGANRSEVEIRHGTAQMLGTRFLSRRGRAGLDTCRVA
jgi:hypothetical protein